MAEHMELKPGYPGVQILALTPPICVTLGKLLNLSVPQFSQLQDGDSPIDSITVSIVDFLGGVVVKNLPVSAGDLRDMDSIPGSGISLEEGTATQSNILAWRIPWAEEPGGYSP